MWCHLWMDGINKLSGHLSTKMRLSIFSVLNQRRTLLVPRFDPRLPPFLNEKMDKNKLYQKLFQTYTNVFFPTKSKEQCQKDVIAKWNEIKNEADLQVKVESLLQEWNAIDMKRKARQLNFWGKQVATRSKEAAVASATPIEFSADSEQFKEPDSDHEDKTNSIPTNNHSKSKAVVQEQLKSDIALLDADLVALYKRKTLGFLDENQEKELRLKIKKKEELELKLKHKISDQKRAKKARDDRKAKLAKITEDNPDIKKALKLRDNPGRPRIEQDQPLLLKTIIEIAMYGSAAHEKRQSDIYRSVKTLDELTTELKKDGFEISRSGVYLRLLPKKSNTHEGKRHTVTVPP